jgi:hypothetical protein
MSFSDMLDKLQFGAMGLVIARKGDWGVAGDAISMGARRERDGPRASGRNGERRHHSGRDRVLWTRRLSPAADFMFGGRVNTLQAPLGFNGPGQRSAEGSKTWLIRSSVSDCGHRTSESAGMHRCTPRAAASVSIRLSRGRCLRPSA